MIPYQWRHSIAYCWLPAFWRWGKTYLATIASNNSISKSLCNTSKIHHAPILIPITLKTWCKAWHMRMRKIKQWWRKFLTPTLIPTYASMRARSIRFLIQMSHLSNFSSLKILLIAITNLRIERIHLVLKAWTN